MFNKITAIALCIMFLISLVGALGFLLISGKVFMIIFWLLTGLQLFIGYPINRYLEQKQKSLDIYSKLLTKQELEIHTAQHTNVECAYCNVMNSVQVHLNNDYRFECRSCGEISKVIVDTRSCRTTDLGDISDIEIPKSKSPDIKIPNIGKI
jgi:hypothetical protein